MDYIYLCGLNLGCCLRWMIRLNISKTYWIIPACYEPNLLYGGERVWLVTTVLHNVLHIFLHIQVVYMIL